MPSIRSDPGWTRWVRIGYQFDGSTSHTFAPKDICIQDAADFGITIGYSSRWYSVRILALRVFAPVNGTDGILMYVYDPSNGASIIDRIDGASQGAVVTPNGYGIKYGKVISQFTFTYTATQNIIELAEGPAGLWWFDFQVVFS